MSIPLGYKYLRYCKWGIIRRGVYFGNTPFLGFTQSPREYFSIYMVIYMVSMVNLAKYLEIKIFLARMFLILIVLRK